MTDAAQRPTNELFPRVGKLLTTVVGSYPQPDWLIDRQALGGRLPPRVRATELWLLPPESIANGLDEAAASAIRDLEEVGVDVVTDGETRRESYSNAFATALDGVDAVNPGRAIDRTGKEAVVPRIAGEVGRSRPVLRDEAVFLRRQTARPVKVTLPGPFTMTQQAQNDFYPDERSLALDFAVAVNQEARELFAVGVDVVQIDEPYLQARSEKAREYALEAIDRALDGLEGVTAMHTCFGYAHVVHEKPRGYGFLNELNECAVDQISLEAAQPRLDPAILRVLPDKTVIWGVLDLGTEAVETPDEVARRIRGALEHIEPERLVLAPDCGMKYLSRDVAMGKLRAMVEGAQIVRAEIAS